MSCTRCGSDLILKLQGKCSDCTFIQFNGFEREGGGVPSIKGLGGGDYIRLEACVACGQLQGFPQLTEFKLREALGEEPPELDAGDYFDD